MPTREENAAIKRAAIDAARDRQGRLRPEILVRQARAEDHPLHHSFIWDDQKAAHRLRVEQAKEIIRRFKFELVIENRKIAVPFYIHDPTAADSAYRETAWVADSKDTARRSLDDEIGRVRGAVIRGRALAAAFGLTAYFEKKLAAAVRARLPRTRSPKLQPGRGAPLREASARSEV